MRFMKSKIFVPTIFFSIVGANIFSLSIMSFFETNTRYIGFIFVVTFIFSGCLFRKSRIEFPALNKKEHLLSIALGLFLSIPRLPYLLEPLLGYSVNAACWDDWWHIQELSSIIYSKNFPPKSTFAPDYFLSFYFAPWMFGGALFSTELFSTIKQIIYILHCFYGILFFYVVIYSGKILFPLSAQSRKALYVCIVFFGGFDFFYGAAISFYYFFINGTITIEHAEWWANLLGFQVQFSNFITLVLWVPHHLLSAVAILFGTYCITRKHCNTAATIVAGTSYSFALFSSVFTTLGASPIIGLLLVRNKVKIHLTMVSIFVAFSVSAPIIWMYLGREDVGFVFFGTIANAWKDHKIIGFALFIGIILLEFLPIIFPIIMQLIKGNVEVPLMIISTLFIISAYFISYEGTGNYSMRGSIVPIFVIMYLAAKGSTNLFVFIKSRPYLIVMVIPFFLGGIWEYYSFSFNAYNSFMTRHEFNYDVFKSNVNHGVIISDRLLNESTKSEYGWYLLENMKLKKKEILIGPDIQLMIRDNKYRISVDTIMNR